MRPDLSSSPSFAGLRVSRALSLLAVLSLTAAPVPARDWFYWNRDEKIPLQLNTDTIAIFEENPEPATVSGKRWVRTPKGTLPGDDIGGGWILVDISGGPAGGNEDAIVELVSTITSDPTTRIFATTTFGTANALTMVMPTVHVAFPPEMAQATIDALIQNAGLGEILESPTPTRRATLRASCISRRPGTTTT